MDKKKKTASKIMWEVSSIGVRSSRSCLSVCLFVYIGRSVCLCVNILNRSIGGVGQVYNVVSFLPVCVCKRPTLSLPKIRMHTTVRLTFPSNNVFSSSEFQGTRKPHNALKTFRILQSVSAFSFSFSSFLMSNWIAFWRVSSFLISKKVESTFFSTPKIFWMNIVSHRNFINWSLLKICNADTALLT